jgi:hypothetical protein
VWSFGGNEKHEMPEQKRRLKKSIRRQKEDVK